MSQTPTKAGEPSQGPARETGPDGLRRRPPRRTLPGLGRPSLWPRPGQRDLTQAATGRPGPATAIRAREWTMVLTARSIPHVLRRQGDGYRLYVPRRRAEEALAEIGGYAAERRAVVLPDPEAEPVRPRVWPAVLAWMGLVTAAWGFLLGEKAVLGRRIAWKTLGAGDSAAMLAGQWYRAATALCLHADPAHLLGNAASGALFLSLLCRETGVGLGFAATLAAGVAGNVLKVLIQGPGMHFLGASTAVFGALGVLGGVRLASRWPPLSFRRSAPAGAVLMLLAMLGAGGEDGMAVDLAGHLFGFASGLALGLGLGFRLERRGRPGAPAQLMFGLLALGGLAAAWSLAVLG
ncbi:rhomboid family intramembrane serine protease [Solidesulfovibrio sp.]